MIITDERIYEMIIDILRCGENPIYVKQVQDWIKATGLDEVFMFSIKHRISIP